MSLYLSFFEAHIQPPLQEDTNTRIGTTLVALAYPSIILIEPPPYFHNTVVDVKKQGLQIKIDDYPLLQFLQENSEFCKTIIYSHAGLLKCFEKWTS
jgi:hypothetical protein